MRMRMTGPYNFRFLSTTLEGKNKHEHLISRGRADSDGVLREMHTQAAPLPSYHIPGGFEHLYQRSASLTLYSENEKTELEGADDFLDSSYPGCLYSKLYKSARLSSSLSSSSSSRSDDSLEIRYQSLEDSHFQKALNQGVFDGVSAFNKRERKRSFRKVRKKANSESNTCDTFGGGGGGTDNSRSSSSSSSPSSSSSSPSYCMNLYEQQQRENKSLNSLRRKESLPKRGERFRKELSNCGINLHDAHEKMNIEEIYQLQEKFFTGLKIGSNDNNTTRREVPSPESSFVDLNASHVWTKRRSGSSIN